MNLDINQWSNQSFAQFPLPKKIEILKIPKIL